MIKKINRYFKAIKLKKKRRKINKMFLTNKIKILLLDSKIALKIDNIKNKVFITVNDNHLIVIKEKTHYEENIGKYFTYDFKLNDTSFELDEDYAEELYKKYYNFEYNNNNRKNEKLLNLI